MKEILEQFKIDSKDASIKRFGSGRIHETYLVTCKNHAQYTLQKLNAHVFEDIPSLMTNIEIVTEHLRSKHSKPRKHLSLIPTEDGMSHLEQNGECWRIYNFIDNSETFDMTTNPEIAYEAAKGYGSFVNNLADLPAEILNETIPDFHNTQKRVDAFEAALMDDPKTRTLKAAYQIDFATKHIPTASLIVDEIKNGTIPLRTVHNDTKLNNVLFDIDTNESICVIDLDTVMPGSLLYDFGDLVRSAASTVTEDELEPLSVHLSMEMFKAISAGFIEAVKAVITPRERELLAFSCIVMTYELGLRFLTDYLEGDTYFKVSYEQQNLDRCQVQFRLAESMIEQEEAMADAIES